MQQNYDKFEIFDALVYSAIIILFTKIMYTFKLHPTKN